MNREWLSGADLSGLGPRGLAVVGFSGGADSTALAHWLMGQIAPARIVLAHVNHLLRGGEADRDEAASRAFAQRFGLRFEVLRADVKSLALESGQGLEECGRQVRYDFFRSLASGEDDRVLTAHNAEDNAETILLNLCRGASLSGLCGIPPRRGKVLRPFLRVSREEIEAYCAANGLSFLTDGSNLSDDYARNRIRHHVVPVLRGVNPQFVQAAGQAAELLSQDRDFLRDEAEKLLEAARVPFGLDASLLREAPKSLGSRALLRYLEEAGCGELSKKHVDEAVRLLREGGSASLPGGVSARCFQNVFSAGRPGRSRPFRIPVGPGETPLPNGKVLILRKKSLGPEESGPKIHNLLFKNALDYDIIGRNLEARTRREGDRFVPAGRHVTKTLKQVFQENHVPVPEREREVLLECGGELAYCESAGVSQKFQVTERTRTALLVDVREKEEF